MSRAVAVAALLFSAARALPGCAPELPVAPQGTVLAGVEARVGPWTGTAVRVRLIGDKAWADDVRATGGSPPAVPLTIEAASSEWDLKGRTAKFTKDVKEPVQLLSVLRQPFRSGSQWRRPSPQPRLQHQPDDRNHRECATRQFGSHLGASRRRHWVASRCSNYDLVQRDVPRLHHRQRKPPHLHQPFPVGATVEPRLKSCGVRNTVVRWALDIVW